MVYVAADLKLREDQQRDQELIENWNSIVEDDDIVLLIGIITNFKESMAIKEIFDQLKGKKRIIDMDFKNSNEVERFKFITKIQPYQLGGFVPGRICDQDVVVMLPSSLEELNKFKEHKFYCAAPASLLNQKEIYQDKCLDISIEKWGDIPILYTDIPVLINNLLTYDVDLRRTINEE